MPRPDARGRVAVIGSGLAGLTTAYLLRQEGYQVHLVEKSPKLGFHAPSVEVPVESSRTQTPGEKSNRATWTVDVPMRSFQGGYYAHLISLYRHLGLPLQPTSYTFSFSHLLPPFHNPKQETHFVYGGNTGLSAPSLPSRAHASLWSSLRGVWHWLENAVCFILLITLAFMMWHDLLPTDLANASLQGFTDGICTILAHPLPLVYTPLGRMWRHFTEDIVVPLYSAVGTMPSQDLWRTPAKVILEYVHAGVGSPHYVLKGHGAAEVARRLASAVQKQGPGYLRLRQEVVDFAVSERGATLHLSDSQGDQCETDEIEVDNVVIATQPSAARSILDMLGEALFRSGDKAELRRVRQMRQAVGEVESRETIIVTHRDPSVLPRIADRRDINLAQPIPPAPYIFYPRSPSPTPSLTPADSSPASSSTASSSRPLTPYNSLPHHAPAPFFRPTLESVHTMATHIIRAPARLRRETPVYQTTNPAVPIDPESVLGVAKLERALPLRDSTTLERLHPPPDPDGRALVHLAGSYAYPGIPLLEGCVGSARRAVEAITGVQGAGQVNWEVGKGGRIGRMWRHGSS